MSSLPWKGNNFCYLFPVLQLCNWRVQRTSTAFFSSYCSFQRRSCAFKSFRIKPVNTRQTSRLCKSVVCKRSFHKVDVLVTEKKIRKMLNKVVAQFRSDCDALLQKGISLGIIAPASYELSLVLCSDSYISSLNSNWRKKDEPTDVLSFAQEDETVRDSSCD